MKADQDLYNSTEEAGAFYGYPECCVKDFCSRWQAPEEKRQFYGTGFIPCPSCNQKPREQLLAEIAKNRKCPTPFPKDGRRFKV